MVGSDDDYDGGGNACRTMIPELSPPDAAHLSLRVFPGATHIFDTFTTPYEFPDPGANRRQGSVIHVRPDPETRQQARDDMVSFFARRGKENEQPLHCHHRFGRGPRCPRKPLCAAVEDRSGAIAILWKIGSWRALSISRSSFMA